MPPAFWSLADFLRSGVDLDLSLASRAGLDDFRRRNDGSFIPPPPLDEVGDVGETGEGVRPSDRANGAAGGGKTGRGGGGGSRFGDRVDQSTTLPAPDEWVAVVVDVAKDESDLSASEDDEPRPSSPDEDEPEPGGGGKVGGWRPLLALA